MPDPNCSLCDGTGWRPVERGEVTGVERCSCNQMERAATLLEQARIPPRFQNASFENFDTRPENPVANQSLARAVVDARRFARDYPAADRTGLLFMGSNGTGKTHLAVATMKILIERGFECVFLDYQTLLERIRASWDPTAGPNASSAYQAALETEVVLLDDLGAHRAHDWIEDTVYAVINHRYSGKKATIVTTNLPDPDLGDRIAEKNPVTGQYPIKDTLADRIGARARSRLFEMCKVVRITATEDFRLRGIR